MPQSTMIEKTCTVTRKGQTTLPLAMRQALGVADGGKVRLRLDAGRVVIEPGHNEHTDPAIEAFLGLLTTDIAAGHGAVDLPDDLASALAAARREVEVDLDEPIEGETSL